MFDGDDLVACVGAALDTVEIAPGVVSEGMPLERLLVLVLDEAYTRAAGGRFMDRDDLSGIVASLADARWKLDPEIASKDPTGEERKVMEVVSSKLPSSWPPKEKADLARSGKVAVVDKCPTDRVALATCSYAGAATARPTGRVSWRMNELRFDVASTLDSDSAMKRCLKNKGSWTALDRGSREVRDAQLRQHSKRLDRMLGQ